MTKVKTKRTWAFPTNNFLYSGVEYEYDSRKCQGCNDDYCHCNIILGLRIESVDVPTLTKTILGTTKEAKELKFFEYSIDRILRINKLYQTSNWEVYASHDYYGESVSSITCNEYSVISKQINHLYEITPNKRVGYVLNLEYNFILDILEGKKYQEITISPKDIVFNKEYVKKIDTPYSKEVCNLPIGVCIKEGIKYKLIDGYHRFIASMNKKKVNIIEAI